jgi:hypothetical protein
MRALSGGGRRHIPIKGGLDIPKKTKMSLPRNKKKTGAIKAKRGKK